MFGNVEVGTHTEIQNCVPSAGHHEFLHSVNVAKTTEVCAGQECMGWNVKKEVLRAMVPDNWSPILVFRGIPELLENTWAVSFSLESCQEDVGPWALRFFNAEGGDTS